jgi:hypothetical protein
MSPGEPVRFILDLMVLNARLIAAASATVIIAVAGVTIKQAVIGPPYGGVSRDRAVAAARSFGPNVRDVLQATVGRCDELESGHLTGCTHAGWLWAVDFSGTWEGSGGASAVLGNADPARRHSNHSLRVVVDYMTGTAVFAETPSPGYGN